MRLCETTARTVHDGYLILVELAVLVLLFAFFLERDDHEADKDVHHEERDHDDVDEVEDGHCWPMIVHWTVILGVRVDTAMH